ncbi:MAG: hypothetical protein V2B19_22260 [Pseudomonadota bacterium]
MSEEILSESRLLKDLKNYRSTIKVTCRTCDKADHCYGCRGAAYQLTSDYLASDPLCWHNVDCGHIQTESGASFAGNSLRLPILWLRKSESIFIENLLSWRHSGWYQYLTSASKNIEN